jgi:hypothetical protein
MANPMPVRVELWPLAADDLGIWLISGDDALRSGPVASDSEPHAEAELLAAMHLGADVPADIYHSTSWRPDGQSVILTYVACFAPAGEFVRDTWPGALPVSARMHEAVGNPPGHGAAEPPAPRYVDVLMHAIRHLRFLMDTDATASAAMTPTWRKHLAAWAPALSGMYSEPHRAAS